MRAETFSPGTFATFNLLKTGVGWSAPPGSTFSYTGTTPHILFDDSATGANGAVVSAITADKIIAHGTQSTGQTYHDGFAVTVDNAASNVRIVADEIYGGTTAAGIDEGCAIRQSGGYLDIVAKKITGPQGSIYWRNGECHIRAGLISGTVWNDMATTPTGALWVDADLIVEPAADLTCAVYCGGSQPTAQVWVRAKEIRSAYTGILCGGGKNYIDTLKLTYTGVGNSAIFLSGVSKSWVTAQKISGAVLQVGAVGATLDLSTQEWLDDTGDTGNFILMAANSEVHIHGGYFKAVSCAGISAADGSLRVSDATIDMSAVAGSNPVALSGGMVILQNTTLIARAGQASIVSDGNPRTIYCYHCVANTAPDANVTVLPPGGLTISANVQ